MQRCLRCEHEWQEKPEGHKPIRCPKCQSTYWSQPYKWIKNQDSPTNIGQPKQEVESW